MALYKDVIEAEAATVKIYISANEPHAAYLYVSADVGKAPILTREDCVRVAHSLLAAALRMSPRTSENNTVCTLPEDIGVPEGSGPLPDGLTAERDEDGRTRIVRARPMFDSAEFPADRTGEDER